MSPTLTTFLFEAANFLALAGLLTWIFFRPVRRALDEHRQQFEQRAEEASRRLQEVERRERDLEEQRQRSEEQARTRGEQILEAARQEAETLVEQAQARIAAQRQRHAQELADWQRAESARLSGAVAAAAGDAVVQLLQQIDGPELQRGLLRAALREAAHENGLSQATLESAVALDDAALGEACQGLKLTGQALQQRINPELLAGVRIVTDQGMVDASIRGLAQFAGQRLAERLQAGER